MRLYIGGAYQGKLAQLRRELPAEEIAFCGEDNAVLDLSRQAVCGLHLWVRAALSAGLDPVEEVRDKLDAFRAKTILCDVLGSGIVPLTREDRRWRESTGRVLQLLSGEADTVLEFLAGIPRVLVRRQTVYLLRHGLTQDNLDHRYCGFGDPPLCPEGRSRLEGRHYPAAERYFSSPSLRAVETLRALYGAVDYTVCEGLMECGFGEYEGHTYEELKKRPDYEAWILDETGEAAPPGGESRNAHGARVRAAMDAIMQQDFSSAALLTHGGTIVRLMESFFPGEKGKKDFYQWQPEHGAGWKVRFENGAPAAYAAINGREEPV